jgi:hypothetical protein
MLSTPSCDQTAWPVYLSVANLTKAKRGSVNTNRLLLIGVWLKCPNRPISHINLFAEYGSIAARLCALEELVKSGLAILCADGHTHYAIPWSESFLAHHPVPCPMTMLQNSWCLRCEVSPDDTPGFTRRPQSCHPQLYLHLLTTSTEEVGLWNITDCPNFADSHAGCNKYSFIHVDQLHQLLKGVLQDVTWEWTSSVQKDI